MNLCRRRRRIVRRFDPATDADESDGLQSIVSCREHQLVPEAVDSSSFGTDEAESGASYGLEVEATRPEVVDQPRAGVRGMANRPSGTSLQQIARSPAPQVVPYPAICCPKQLPAEEPRRSSVCLKQPPTLCNGRDSVRTRVTLVHELDVDGSNVRSEPGSEDPGPVTNSRRSRTTAVGR